MCLPQAAAADTADTREQPSWLHRLAVPGRRGQSDAWEQGESVCARPRSLKGCSSYQVVEWTLCRLSNSFDKFDRQHRRQSMDHENRHQQGMRSILSLIWEWVSYTFQPQSG